MQIFEQFTFDSAHFLPHVPNRHKCKEIHGHTYRLSVFVEGELQNKLEWVMDFAQMKNVIDRVVKSIYYKLLNNISGFKKSSLEIITVWLLNKIKPKVPPLTKTELRETPTSGAIYEGSQKFAMTDILKWNAIATEYTDWLENQKKQKRFCFY